MGKLKEFIHLNQSEIRSGYSRVNWAEGLILQLPENHDGRNSWLLNYGIKEKAQKLRADKSIEWNEKYQSANTCSEVDNLDDREEDIVDYIIAKRELGEKRVYELISKVNFTVTRSILFFAVQDKVPGTKLLEYFSVTAITKFLEDGFIKPNE